MRLDDHRHSEYALSPIDRRGHGGSGAIRGVVAVRRRQEATTRQARSSLGHQLPAYFVGLDKPIRTWAALDAAKDIAAAASVPEDMKNLVRVLACAYLAVDCKDTHAHRAEQ
ncbi:MAG: hypothetical protein OXI16_08765 [Chloroflexota bacterium]|nr:hypothetical protein [Chloroflexota bacterium]